MIGIVKLSVQTFGKIILILPLLRALLIFLQSKSTQILTSTKEMSTNNNLKVGFLIVVLIQHKFFSL